MKVILGDTFTKTSKRMNFRYSRFYKYYSIFRYDIPRFFKNIWKFRKALYGHYWFDHHGTLMFLEIGITDMADKTEKYGIEIKHSRLKKVQKMRRAVELIKNYNEDRYTEFAEKELGPMTDYNLEFEPAPDHPGSYQMVEKRTEEEKEHDHKIIVRSREIGEEQWNELFEILKGQDYSKFNNDIDFDEQFDGSGIRGWWD
jgi:hypothetical protein